MASETHPEGAHGWAKARADLGWDTLIEHLASRCHTARGTASARLLPLATDPDAIRARLDEVAEARDLHDTGSPMLFGGAVDVEPSLERAEKGGHLEGPALREIGETIATAARLRKQLLRARERTPRLAGRAALLAELADVAGPIEDAFDDGARLRDTASPSLGGLRRRAALLHEELSRRARSLLENPLIAPHLQDTFYTQREERYVVPIRADARSRVKGIVHGTSGSGQTVFIEPEEIVDLNNRLKLAELEVVDEERRILGELTRLVTDALGPLRVNLEVMAALDLLDGAARLAIDLTARLPLIAEGEGARIDLRNARHPLMVLSGAACVPNDIVLARGGTLIVSGPNAGGKTVALKTSGLLALMLRAGLHLPAQEGSSLPIFDRVLTDVGDDQSLEQNLSTFSAHVGHLNRFLAVAGPGTLVLLDEVAVGTDPEQGAALAQAVLEALAERGATVVVTTHYDRLKALGARGWIDPGILGRGAPPLTPLGSPRFANASVGFDLEHLEPTYRLHLGVPGASGAIVVARRLGLPVAIAARASALCGEGPKGLEELLRAVDGERRRLEIEVAAAVEERAAAVVERRRAETLAVEAKERLSSARKSAHDEAVAALQKARVELDRARRQLKGRATESELAEVRQQIDRAGREVHELAPALPAAAGRVATAAELSAGTEVLVPRLGGRGIVTAAPRDGKVALQVGALRLTVEVGELLLPDRPAPKAPPSRKMRPADDLDRAAAAMAPGSGVKAGLMRTVGNTCDLRGERVDAACGIAEKFIDEALRDAQDVVFFVHGHGTGALRAALRERLSGSPAVDAVRAGTRDEGGDGVTVVTLA
ncbi:MAG: endonuclease MutS2 [Myxococcales bacterium]|nr:endonuclease MutS2 [Myxococcales bacterium]